MGPAMALIFVTFAEASGIIPRESSFHHFQITEFVQCHNHKILGEFDFDPSKPHSYI